MRVTFLSTLLVVSSCFALTSCKNATFVGGKRKLPAGTSGDQNTANGSTAGRDDAGNGNPTGAASWNSSTTGTDAGGKGLKPFALNLLCPANGGRGAVVRNLTIAKGSRGTISGEICLSQNISNNAADFVFVVDVSGSMGNNDPDCKRRDAVKAVIRKIAASARPDDDFRFGLVRFHTSSNVISRLTDLNSISSIVNNGDLCEHTGNTNYENAFKDTRGVLANSGNRQKIVYFLSDGLPTEDDSSGSPEENGLDEANSVHALGNVKIFSIFLTGTGGSLPWATPGDRSYLEKISRSAENVRVAGSAADLVSEILKFEIPAVPGLAASDLQLSVTAEGAAATAIGIASLKANAADPKIWNFTSNEFAPLQGRANPTNNIFSLSVRKSGIEDFFSTDSFSFTFE